MARTKQTARKDTGGKPLAMGRGRGKATPKKNPTPGGRADRKVVLEYCSEETQEEGAQRPAEGAEAPKLVKNQIHLTLPTSPAHVTTTETFATFFINHGLTRALQKAFAKKGWSTDQMREIVTNFQKKHGQQVPMPKIYGDEDSTDDKGPELADGTKAVKKTTAVHVVVLVPVHVVTLVHVRVVAAEVEPRGRSGTETLMMMRTTPANVRRPRVKRRRRN